LKQAEAGSPVTELCREHGMSDATFYKWRAKFGGMDVSMMSPNRFVRVADEISLTQPTQQIAASKGSGRWPACLVAETWQN